MGADVVSVNRSGAPAGKDKDWKDMVRWIQADIFKPEDYAAEVCAVTGPGLVLLLHYCYERRHAYRFKTLGSAAMGGHESILEKIMRTIFE